MTLVEYPYALVQKNLREFIRGIPGRGIPPVVNKDYLAQVGFKSGNDVPIISILTFIGFIDDEGKPTIDYKEFRVSSKQETAMTNALKTAYSELFTLYPDAHLKSQKELSDFFTEKTESGAQVVTKTVKTFLILCEFSELKPSEPVSPPRKKPTKKKPSKKVPVKKDIKPAEISLDKSLSSRGVAINLNIQLTLPESSDSKLFEELFKALKKHLLE